MAKKSDKHTSAAAYKMPCQSPNDLAQDSVLTTKNPPLPSEKEMPLDHRPGSLFQTKYDRQK